MPAAAPHRAYTAAVQSVRNGDNAANTGPPERIDDGHDVLGKRVGLSPLSIPAQRSRLRTGVYTIQQRSSGLFLDAHEVAAEAFFVVLRPRQTFDSTQLWRIVEYGGGFVTIQQVSSGRFLDATINAAVNYQVVTGLNRTQSQEWRLGSP